jgi:hypothetical protein
MTVTPNPFSHLEMSKNADSIYYADLFKINNKIWMITGFGKSQAAKIAVNKNDKSYIAQDAVAIIRDNNILYGCYDSGAINSFAKDLPTLHKIDFIAYCLSDVQSQDFYLENPRAIEEINNNFVAIHLNNFPYTGSTARYICSSNQYNWLSDVQRRYDRFLELTDNITTTQFVVVPWMVTVEEKALLYTSF